MNTKLAVLLVVDGEAHAVLMNDDQRRRVFDLLTEMHGGSPKLDSVALDCLEWEDDES